MSDKEKLWGGRFQKRTHPDVDAFSSSLNVDHRLWDADIRASIAQVGGLIRAGVLSEDEGSLLKRGLLALKKTDLDPSAEDVHSEIERLLKAVVGPLAGKVHTGRSRNDQVVTATRLYLREEVDALIGEIKSIQRWIVTTAERHKHTWLPGLTHTQHAQPVSLAHHLLAYFWMLERDRERLTNARDRMNELPLGSGALAGTPYFVDRERMAQELGFIGICENSLDAVSDRDFVVEFLAAATLIQIHLSRWCEEIILWSTPEFSFLELDDDVSTGSSLMPQKKNPDVAELIRGRAGRVAGALTASILMLKGLPLSYHRDLQEDKVHLFEGLDTTRSCVRLMRLMIERMKFREEKMKAVLTGDFSNATDLADILVAQGVPFREAHEIVGKIVHYCLEKNLSLETLPLTEYQKFVPSLDPSLYEKLSPEAVGSIRATRGGTAPSAVTDQIRKAKERL